MLEQSGLPQRCVDAIAATIPGNTLTLVDEDTRRLAHVACAADAFARYLCDHDCGVAMVVLQDRLAQMESSVLTVEHLNTEVRQKIDESSSLFDVDPSVLPNPEDLLQDALDQLSDFTEERPFQVLKFALDWNREILYDRINRRVDKMLAEGLEAEALELYPKKHLNALQTVGYQEFFDFFDSSQTSNVSLK